MVELASKHKPKILVMCFSYLHKDPRVQRQVEWLKDDFEITSLGFSPTDIDGIKHINIDLPDSTLQNRYESFLYFVGRSWKVYRKRLSEHLQAVQYDFIIANDLDPLPLAFEFASKNTKVIFDAHEYYPHQLADDWKVKLLRVPAALRLCRDNIKNTYAATTVCESIAKIYEAEFGKKFGVIPNATRFYDLNPSPVNENTIRLIYHGNLNPSRETERHILMMDHLDERFELNLILISPRTNSYAKGVFEMAEKHPRVNLLEPVAFNEIATFTNQFDIGVFILPPKNTNYKFALPNKFYEFIQARLGIAVGPSPEMAKIVKENNLGLVAEDFEPETMAAKLNSLTNRQVMEFKENAAASAKKLSAESNREKFLKLFL